MGKMKILVLALIFMAIPLFAQGEKTDTEKDGSSENEGTISLSQRSLPKESQYWRIGPMNRVLIIPGKNTALFVEFSAEKYFIPYFSAYGTLGLGLDVSWNKNFPVQQTSDYNGSPLITYYKQSYYLKNTYRRLVRSFFNIIGRNIIAWCSMAFINRRFFRSYKT